MTTVEVLTDGRWVELDSGERYSAKITTCNAADLCNLGNDLQNFTNAISDDLAQMCNLFSFEFATNLLIAVGTGTRLGEIFRLRWRDILAEEIRKYPAVLGEGRFASGAKSNKWASAYG